MKVPAAYTVVAAGRVRAAIRRDLVPRLASWLLAPRLIIPPGAERIASGRGGAYRVVLEGDLRLIVRPYRRGGVVARVVRDSYFGMRPRPLRELALTAEIRRRGVATAEVLAARVEGRLVYRGALVTAEVPAAATLAEALGRAADGQTRCALARRAGETIAGLHEAGVFHADLNLHNILVHPAGMVLLDFDRARLRDQPLGPRARRRNLARLGRSLAKLDPGGRLAGTEERRAFRTGYGAQGSEACAS